MHKFFSLLDHINRTMRLLIALAVGFMIFGFLVQHHSVPLSFMMSWIGFAGTFLFFCWVTILGKHPRETGTLATEQDSSYLTIFLVALSAAFVSIFAVLLLLQSLPSQSKTGFSLHMLLSLVAIMASWLLIHTLFTIRYAHLYYTYADAESKKRKEHFGGLEFPNTPSPDFMDFAYYSFIIGFAFQTADVSITGSRIRHLSLLHGFISFLFNTVLIALGINIISGLLKT